MKQKNIINFVKFFKIIPVLFLMMLTLTGCKNIFSLKGNIGINTSKFDNIIKTKTHPTPTITPTAGPPLDLGGHIGYKVPSGTSCEYYRNLWNIDDEYFCNQWHLFNIGQKIKRIPTSIEYSITGQPGADIRAEYAKKHYDGEGVKIYITDNGLYSDHPDIHNNFLDGYNNCTGANNSKPEDDDILDTMHGTMVSGIIGAESGNGIGVTGIAPKVKIFMNNIVSRCQYISGTSGMIKATKAEPGFNIWSGSFGVPACAGMGLRSHEQAIIDAYTLGASQYNILYFKANGNDALNDVAHNSCMGIGNTDPANTHFAVASIAAVDIQGRITSYSTRGPNLLLAAFAGYGGGKYNNGPSPGIVTLYGQNQYTSNMNGTSAATPVTSGSAALLVEAAPHLKWYDYQVILARAATLFDEPQVQNSAITGVSDINYLTNDAGYRHSYNYGLGVLDIDAAISVALNGYQPLPELVEYQNEFGTFPQTDLTVQAFGGSSSCTEKQLTVDQDLQIFDAEWNFDITMPNFKDLSIFVTTPLGNKGQIMRTSQIPGSNLNYDQFFKSMQFFAMSTKGTWKIQICGKSAGTFNSARVNFYGFKGSPIPKRK